jgi:hypothetical protein
MDIPYKIFNFLASFYYLTYALATFTDVNRVLMA